MDLLAHMAGIPIIPKQCFLVQRNIVGWRPWTHSFWIIWLAGWKTQIFLSTIRTFSPRVTFSWTQMSQHWKMFPKKCTWKWIDVWNGCQIIYLRSNNGATLIVPPPKRHSPTLLYWLLRFFSCRPAPCGGGVLSINWMAQELHPRRFP